MRDILVGRTIVLVCMVAAVALIGFFMVVRERR
jgi:hypothetical protein